MNIPKGLMAGALLVAASAHVCAQDTVMTRDRVDFDSPEGWAMAHATSSTMTHAARPLQTIPEGNIRLSVELGSIPHISAADTRVGFGGFKLEDLNKSPVFGRATAHYSLPGEFVASLSWTPPVRINGAKARDLFAVTLERRMYQGPIWQFGARLYAQTGAITGDITCSRDVVANTPGSAENPFGCRAPSRDIATLDHHGFVLSVARSMGDTWQPFAGLALTRMTPEVRVRANVFEIHDRSEVHTRGTTTSMTLGTTHQINPEWSWSAALRYTPLDVRRPFTVGTRSDDHWAVHATVRWDGPLRMGG
jgi:hypothetical protein